MCDCFDKEAQTAPETHIYGTDLRVEYYIIPVTCAVYVFFSESRVKKRYSTKEKELLHEKTCQESEKEYILNSGFFP